MQVLPTAPVSSNHSFVHQVVWQGLTYPKIIAADMESLEMRDFVASYASELADLTFNSKPIINTLTMLASENLGAASSIAAAVERHILMVRLIFLRLATLCHRLCSTSW